LTETRSVPCGMCTLCCRGGEAIILHPECGDDISQYETREVWHPIFHDRPVHMLEQRENGDCIYVGPFGCTIWDRRPTICREFDCRALVRRIDESKEFRRKVEKAGMVGTAVMRRGRELLAQEKAAAE
jgi:Fe-S-cluster containining protein